MDFLSANEASTLTCMLASSGYCHCQIPWKPKSTISTAHEITVAGHSSQLYFRLKNLQLQGAQNIICHCVCVLKLPLFVFKCWHCIWVWLTNSLKHDLCHKLPQIQAKPSEHICISSLCVQMFVWRGDLLFTFGIRDLTSFANVCGCVYTCAVSVWRGAYKLQRL